MYQSELPLDKKPFSALKKYFISFLKKHKKIYCPSLGRPVFLEKQPDAILKRKDAKHRLQGFPVGIDILKHSRIYKKWNNGKESGFAITGLSQDKKVVTAHIRQEVKNKDKKLFLISVFHK